jgi:hypothetical protein
MASTIKNAGRLFRIATTAADSINATERNSGQQAALTSLVFAVIGCTSFFKRM